MYEYMHIIVIENDLSYRQSSYLGSGNRSKAEVAVKVV